VIAFKNKKTNVTRGGPWAPSLVKQNVIRTKFIKSFTV